MSDRKHPATSITFEAPESLGGRYFAISPNRQWLSATPGGTEVAILQADSGKEQARVRGHNLLNLQGFHESGILDQTRFGYPGIASDMVLSPVEPLILESSD